MTISITTRSITEFDDPKHVLLRHINNTPGIRCRELLRLTGLSNGVLAYHLSGLRNPSKLGLIDKRKKEQLDII